MSNAEADTTAIELDRRDQVILKQATQAAIEFILRSYDKEFVRWSIETTLMYECTSVFRDWQQKFIRPDTT